jgi:hypothetical protein
VDDGLARALRKKLRDHMNVLADHLADGRCEDIQDYRHITGKIAGLALAERELLDLAKEEFEAE